MAKRHRLDSASLRRSLLAVQTGATSVRQVMRAAGLGSTSTAHRYIRALTDTGAVERAPVGTLRPARPVAPVTVGGSPAVLEWMD